MIRIFLPFLSLFAFCSVIFILIAICLLLGVLVYRGLPTINTSLFFGDMSPIDAVLGLKPVWDGIWPAFIGTMELIFLTVSIALLPGVGCGIFLAEYASITQRHSLQIVVDVLAGIPSIIMGLFGFSLIITLRHTIWPAANTSLLLASSCLALLVLPVIIATTYESLSSVPKELKITALALGFSREQCIWSIQIPSARKGIWSGILLAIGRSAEDTSVILLTGVVANTGFFAGLSSKFEALPFVIYYTAAQYQSQEELNRGFGAAIILLIIISSIWLLGRLLKTSVRIVGGGK